MRSTLIGAADTRRTPSAPRVGCADVRRERSGRRAPAGTGVVGSRSARRPGPGKAGITVEIRIGIANSRELSFDSNETAEAVKQTIVTALDNGANYVTLADAKGATYLIPTAGITFVEVGTDQSRRVGFVA